MSKIERTRAKCPVQEAHAAHPWHAYRYKDEGPRTCPGVAPEILTERHCGSTVRHQAHRFAASGAQCLCVGSWHGQKVNPVWHPRTSMGYHESGHSPMAGDFTRCEQCDGSGLPVTVCASCGKDNGTVDLSCGMCGRTLVVLPKQPPILQPIDSHCGNQESHEAHDRGFPPTPYRCSGTVNPVEKVNPLTGDPTPDRPALHDAVSTPVTP